ncbi:MAG: 1-acyl-sn-glycerol-3-phosphate acyltransferase [Bacteroidales bacterium]|nr:1-acyl-sn-glycerol-3-phosphate acyltransferase [Bacteroidales bacterium]
MNIENIEKWSFKYALFKGYSMFWNNDFFYKDVVIYGKENLPKDGHLIFTPNHQNALMDAAAIFSAIDTQLVFMARSDIFNNPLIAKFLIILKILPIYRIRDGFETLKKNNDVFQKTIDVIKNKNGLVILPEGSHDYHRRLRPLKKGFARIAFQTEEANNFSLDLKIVPIGIYYSNFEDLRSSLLVMIGKPIPVSDFYELYKESPVKAINGLTSTLSEHIKPLIVNIESEEFYDLYNELREIYKYRMCERLSLPNCNQPNKLKADQELIKIVSKYEKDNHKEMPEFQELVLSYNKKLTQSGFTNEIIENGHGKIINLLLLSVFLILSFPVFLYGFINNILPFGLSVKFSKKAKDRQFRSSFKYVLLMVLFPLFYIFQTLIVLIFTSWKIAGVYLLSMPVFGIFAWWYSFQFKKLILKWKFYFNKRSQNTLLISLLNMHGEIISRTDQIIADLT